MPLGSRHIETGLLLVEGAWLILNRDQGGRWRLDVSSRARKLLGQRVRIEGAQDAVRLEPGVGPLRGVGIRQMRPQVERAGLFLVPDREKRSEGHTSELQSLMRSS